VHPGYQYSGNIHNNSWSEIRYRHGEAEREEAPGKNSRKWWAPPTHFFGSFSELPSAGFDTLLTTDITKSSAMQRAGRAGREGHGYCFRLYTETAFDSMAASAEPEVQRSNLTSAVLQLKVIDQDIESMQFMDTPDQESGMFISHRYTILLDVV
jgi:hypothetical protein